jgi:predicted amidophosphoribosyltransferase
VEKFFQDYQGEPDDMIKRIQQLVEVQQTREQLVDKGYDHQLKIKQAFEKKVNKEDFELGDLVLKWDAPRQDKGKHGKFEALWTGPFKIFEVFSNNTFKFQNMENEEVFGGPVNGHFLKKYFA